MYWHPWFPLFPLLWLAVVIVAVAVLRRTVWRRHCVAGGDTDALAELGRRYARGEIDEDEYRARRAVLTEHRQQR